MPLIAAIAEVIGLTIIVLEPGKGQLPLSACDAVPVTANDFHHEMSSGLTTALEF